MSPKDIAKKHLATSGLTLKHAEQLGMVVEQAAKELLPSGAKPVPSLRINYYDLKGKLRKDMYRVRVLETVRGTYNEELKRGKHTSKKEIRYLQPKGAPPAAYFPRTMSWEKIAKNSGQQLLITEGEKKAACSCLNGFPTIGLGGVWNWRSAKRQWSLLPELEAFDWKGRDVVIVFDSDITTNADVKGAASRLCVELLHRGAKPRVALIPAETEGAKIGLDDFIVANGVDAFRDIIAAAPADALSAALHRMNSRYIFVSSVDVLFDEHTRAQLKPRNAVATALANIWCDQVVAGPNGPVIRKVQVAKKWFEWELRRDASDFTYIPGAEMLVRDRLNLWSGWGVEEKEGDIKPWLDHLDYLMGDASPEERLWFERWLAYPFQHPGTKMQTAVCLWALAQGVGKSLTGLLIGDCYGKNFSEIPQKEFESEFTAWGVGKQFILVDDVNTITRTEARDYASRLKTLVTQELFKVNIKHVANYSVPDCANYMLTSNSPDALLIDEHDRRFFVHHCPEKAKDKKWYDRLDEWRHTTGPAALLYYLRRFDLGDQDRNTRPPRNYAKAEMAAHTRPDHEQWALDLRDGPDEMLKVDKAKLRRDIFKVPDLHALYCNSGTGRNVALNTFGVALARAGFHTRVVSVDGTCVRLVAARHQDKWWAKSPAEWAKHYGAMK